MSEPYEDGGGSQEMDIETALAVIDRLRFVLGRGLGYVADAQDPKIAAWQLSFALGTDNCVGHTMTSKATELGVTPACISKGAVALCRGLELPPSPYMLKEGMRNSYRELRRTQEEERDRKRVGGKQPRKKGKP